MANKKKIELKTDENKRFKRAEDFVSLYVNNTTFGYSRFDFQIVFGRVEVTRDPDQSYIRETANITMTPEYAKAFHVDLGKILAEYEAAHGPIVVRPDPTEAPEN